MTSQFGVSDPIENSIEALRAHLASAGGNFAAANDAELREIARHLFSIYFGSTLTAPPRDDRLDEAVERAVNENHTPEFGVSGEVRRPKQRRQPPFKGINDMRTNNFQTTDDCEHQYTRALSILTDTVAQAIPNEYPSLSEIQSARDMAEHAFNGLDISKRGLPSRFKANVDGMLAGTTWKDVDGQIVSRTAEFRFRVFPRVREFEMRPAIRFMLQRPETGHEWEDFFAWVRKVDGEWRVVRDGANWLDERKRQFGLNDAEIDVIHHALERMPFDDPDAP